MAIANAKSIKSLFGGTSPSKRQGGSGQAFLPSLKERARRVRRQEARPCRPGTGIEATTKAARACSKGALSAKKPTLRRRKTLLCGKSYAILHSSEPAFLREEGGPLAVEGASGRVFGKLL